MLKKNLAACAVAALCSISATTYAAAQTSYPVICRGGGDMRFSAEADGSAMVAFQPGTQGASVAPPSAGSCSWLDRGFRDGEPGLLSVDGNPAAARYFFENMLNGSVFYAHIYNSGDGRMIVTRVGP